jgi:hypothetical protein
MATMLVQINPRVGERGRPEKWPCSYVRRGRKPLMWEFSVDMRWG